MNELKMHKLFSLIVCSMVSLSANAQTFAEVERELLRQRIPHHHIVLAQARLESGNMKSPFYKRTNNLFGIKYKGRYAYYSTWQNSVADYKKRISSRYTGGDYYIFLKKMGYAKDKLYINKLKQFK